MHTHGEGVLKHVVGPSSFGNNNFSGNYAFVLPGYDLTGKAGSPSRRLPREWRSNHQSGHQ